MAYPGSGYPITASSLQVTPCGPLVEQYNELNFRNLYLHQLYLGPNPTQSAMLAANAATGLGATTVNNWPIYDGLAGYSSVVARARGLHTYAGDWHNSFTIVFEDQRFRGSTLLVMGVSVEDGEWGIVGGTGQFAMARGVIQKRLHQRRNDGNIIEITIHGFCPVPKGSQTLPMGPSQQYPMPVYNQSRPTKVGPWGGTGGTPHDINAPQRLESITIRHGWTIDSISFSYTDQAGQWRSAGPWGSSSGGETTMIQLGPSEYVMEVSGTYGPYNNNVVVTSLRVATNLRAYGPFGRAEGTSFTANGRVVGFFGRSGDLLDSIGVYTA